MFSSLGHFYWWSIFFIVFREKMSFSTFSHICKAFLFSLSQCTYTVSLSHSHYLPLSHFLYIYHSFSLTHTLFFSLFFSLYQSLPITHVSHSLSHTHKHRHTRFLIHTLNRACTNKLSLCVSQSLSFTYSWWYSFINECTYPS